MKLDEIVAWYQKKIGTYDKQQWEKSVEQKILDGFSSVTLKTAKLKTELIDVDLVRGSTFPKAKPKQSLLTVIRLAILRYLLLPIYAQWWVKQTSPNIFAILLIIYMTQMFNWALYTYNVHRIESAVAIGMTNSQQQSHLNDTLSKPAEQLEEHVVSLTELLIPMGLSLLLSLIHSQIVATNTASGTKVKRRSFSSASQSGKHTKEPRMRRRRRPVSRIRSQEYADKMEQRKLPNLFKKYNTQQQQSVSQQSSSVTLKFMPETQDSCTLTKSAAKEIELCTQVSASHKIMDLNKTTPLPDVECKQFLVDSRDVSYVVSEQQQQQQRSVNWPVNLQSYAVKTKEQSQQTSAAQSMSSTTASETSTPNATEVNKQAIVVSSSSNSCHGSPSKQVRIDDSVQEFYEELVSNSDVLEQSHAQPQPQAQQQLLEVDNNGALRRHVGEDDGFESLNGKSSSGEETIAHNSISSSLVAGMPIKNQLRQRLNVNTAHNESPQKEFQSNLCFTYRQRKFPLAADSDFDKANALSTVVDVAADVPFQKSKKTQVRDNSVSSGETDEDGDDGEVVSSPAALNNSYNECTTSATEWLGVTTNSEECSYSSDLEHSEDYRQHAMSDENDFEFAPATILNPHGSSDRISCTIWDQQEIKKAQMSVLEISSCIIERVEAMQEASDYIYIGIFFSFLLSMLPIFCRLCEASVDANKQTEIDYFSMPMLLWEKSACSIWTLFSFAFGETQWERAVLIISCLQRICLTTILFLIFAVAERTFKQRFLYAKLFSRLTSARRARKSNLPHFRLNKVRNIKTWLSVRSYLKKRGPQRSVDVIVSAAFLVTLLLLAFLSIEWLRDLVHLHSHLNLEALLWSSCIGVFLLRFMTLGNGIHNKYRSISVLITEQINLYLQIEQKPKKKDELMVANSVLKLAADLLKELETPFKISGLSANPYLFTTIKVVILSALSGVLSEMLGFKLKLHKIKIK